ncbi:MAG TPA: MFS transporter [Acidimicrobiales bacterium]
MCAAQLILSIDFNIVNIANATIERQLHFNAGNLQWTVSAYALTYGGFLLLGGRLVDLLGQRRLFILGIAAFALTSLCAGCSQNAAELIASRAGQGLAASVISPSTLSLLQSLFPDGPARQRALGYWAISGSAGALVGILPGALLISTLGWRWIFFINAPISLLGIIGAGFVLPKMNRDAESRRRLDVRGAITVTAALALVIFGLGEAESAGWRATETLVPLLLAPLMLGLFVVVERRAREPLVPFSLLRRRAAIGNALAVFAAGSSITTGFLAPLLFQQVWGGSALRTGIATIPLQVGFASGARASSVFIGRLGPKRVILMAALFITIGLVWMAHAPAHDAYWQSFGIPMFVRAFGQGMVIVPIALIATSDAPSRDRGIVSGLYNMCGQLGSAIALAGIATVFAATTSAAGGGAHGELRGIHAGFEAATILPLMVVAVALVGLRRPLKPARSVVQIPGGETAPLIRDSVDDSLGC